MTIHMRATLVLDALQMALARRRPEPGPIHHSDHGSQYVSSRSARRPRRRDRGLDGLPRRRV
jgi:putative transposase